MRNTVATMLAIAMLATSVLIGLDLTMVMQTPIHDGLPDAEVPAGAEHEALIQTFYDAANALLAGEHSGLLVHNQATSLGMDK